MASLIIITKIAPKPNQRSRRDVQRTRARSTQSGAALLIILAIFTISAAALLLNALNKNNAQLIYDKASSTLLAQSKEALINWATLPGGAALGKLPAPDNLAINEIPALNYDGSSNLGCPFTTWVPGNNLISTGAAIRCQGRLPWKSLGLVLEAPSASDPTGMMPWYAVSANLLDPCFEPMLNSAVLNWQYQGSYTCTTGKLAYPWLTVHDEKGNILSNRVAAVIILPGAPLGTQNRTTTTLAGTAAYLDTVTVTAACQAPCVAGTYSNANLNPGNDFIMGKDSRIVAATDPGYAQPYYFNDKIVYITIDELIAAAEKRAALEMKINLRNFYANKNYFPFAASIGSSTGDCVSGNTRGMLPTAVGNCGAGDFLAGMPGWFNLGKWYNYLYYTVAPACIPGTVKCNRPAPNNTYLRVGTLINSRALLITTGRPVINVPAQIPALTTPPYAAKGGAQTGYPSMLVSDYLDSIENTNGNDTYDPVETVRSTIYNDQLFIVSP
ncbi:hypothetical protein ACMYR3_10955 [Ampullimonas aquatilis]|uniref:hypothetical protein n=1 Tax=Ampullimonas aquatilis TaxID=1341549 RepID=UPI003C70D603